MFARLGNRIFSATAAAALFALEAVGCSVCFGNQNSSLTQGMNMGIFTLLLFILPVLGGFGAFMARLAWRANHPLEETPEPSGQRIG